MSVTCMIRYEAGEDEYVIEGFTIVDADGDITWIEVSPEDIDADYKIESDSQRLEVWGAPATLTQEFLEIGEVKVGRFEVLNPESVVNQLEDMR